MSAAIYAGSFDPVTNGHLDLIARGARLFDRLIVAVATNVAKQGVFSVPERVEMLRAHTQAMANVEIDSFSGLVVDFARRRGARILLRGVRSMTDFEYEFQMAITNQGLGDVETLVLLPRPEFAYLNARLIREIAALGGDVSHLVPPAVAQALAERLRRQG
jgi:pantetheine-phosphate adenylyltransferase